MDEQETPASSDPAPYQALSREPDDPPLAETISRTFEDPSLLVEHIEALRGHLLRALAGLIIGIVIASFAASAILDWLAMPVGGREALQAIEVTETIGVFMRIAFIAGLSIASPYIGLELYLFVRPGLKRKERRLVLAVIPAALLLFVGGMAFAYDVMLPAALPFLLNFLDIQTNVRPASYFRFVTGVMFWIGVSFQFPLVIYLLARLRLIRARVLLEGWRFAIVGIAVLAAAVTPTIDPINMALVMGPMTLLYFISIGLARLAERQVERSSSS